MRHRIQYIIIALLAIVGSVSAQTLSVQPIEVQTGEQTELTVSLTGATSMTALQFNLQLPTGLTATTDNVTLGAATDGHTLSVQTLESGDLLFVLYSMDLKQFKDGELLRIPVTAGNAATNATGQLYTIRTASISGEDAVSHECSNAQFNVTVTEPEPEGFSNEVLYALTCRRGGLVLNADATGLAAGQTRTDATEEDKCFAIITYNGAQYLYSPVNKKYLLYDGSFVNRLGSPITFDDTHADGDYKYMLFTKNAAGETLYFNNNGNIVIDAWNAPDDGNRWQIEYIDDFDPKEALALAAKQICTVTYEVKYDGKVVATATAEVSIGDALPEPPALLNNSFITLEKSGNQPTTVNDDITVTYTATWNGPFQFSKTLDAAKWYNMHIRSGYYVGKQATEPYYPTQNAGDALKTKEYHWAFGGNPYYVKVYNRTTGFDETLTKDGDNAVMRAGDYSWDLLPNGDGFVLRVTGTENTCINQFGGNSGPLQFWTANGSLTDNGSTFRVEEAQDLDDAILSAHASDTEAQTYYDLSGRRIAKPTTGIYIRNRRKVLVK
ncbi:MAG: hypothetical protein J5671_07930 [Bacteroidaceae bacterium]|nr:hypothetical protein [Bacteroidaceae bacterium]